MVINQPLTAQDTLRVFDQQAIERYQQDVKYDYYLALSQESVLDQLIDWISGLIVPIFGGPNAELIVTWLIRLLLLAALVTAIFLVFKLKYGAVFTSLDKKLSYGISLPTGERIDYEHLLTAARQQGDLKLVLRYSYLLSVDQLSQRRVIAYSPWKTAREYTYELSGEQRELFKDLAQIFEAVWYGHLQPDQRLIDQSDDLRHKLLND